MDCNLPNIDVANIKKLRMKNIEYALGFNEFKNSLENFMKKNNFHQSEIDSIYHILNSYYFMAKDLGE